MSPTRRPSPAEMARAVDRFNAKHQVGEEIVVYTGVRGENPKRATIRYAAQILGGHTPVVYVTGEAHGAIALTHVEAAR